MRVLAINCGSSTLKFRLFELEATGTSSEERRLAAGTVDRIGGKAVVECSDGLRGIRQEEEVADFGEAAQIVFAWLENVGLAADVDSVGHRVVHGGNRFMEPTLLSRDVMREIEDVSDLAPLHNAPALAAIGVAQDRWPSTPMVATFDTAFHRTMPEWASRYALPWELTERHRIYRYGFHGLAHRSMMERYAAITSRPMKETRLITLQLGNGCSATAIDGGRSVDTSMGFTPLEGLLMGTRSGDIDPAVVPYLADREGLDARAVEHLLNTTSGLLGLSGRSHDMRDLLTAEQGGDARAALAVDLFCYRARKYVGAYLAALGGADAVVFGGGIGENAPAVRARICAGMEWCGLRLDAARNETTMAAEGRISAEDSPIAAYVLPVDEELIIARDTVRCVAR